MSKRASVYMPLLNDEGFIEEDSNHRSIMNDPGMLDIIGSVQEREGKLCSPSHTQNTYLTYSWHRICVSTSRISTKVSFSCNSEKDCTSFAIRCGWSTYVIVFYVGRRSHSTL